MARWASPETSASKTRLGDDGLRQLHHLSVGVDDLARPPAVDVALGVLGHDRAIAGHALAVERGLDQPPLAQPRVALGEQEPIAEERPQQAHAGALDEVPVAGHEQLLDGVRVVDEQDAERAHLRLDEVAVLARAFLVEAELVAAEVARGSAEVPAPGAGKGHRPIVPGHRLLHRGPSIRFRRSAHSPGEVMAMERLDLDSWHAWIYWDNATILRQLGALP